MKKQVKETKFQRDLLDSLEDYSIDSVIRGQVVETFHRTAARLTSEIMSSSLDVYDKLFAIDQLRAQVQKGINL